MLSEELKDNLNYLRLAIGYQEDLIKVRKSITDKVDQVNHEDLLNELKDRFIHIVTEGMII